MNVSVEKLENSMAKLTVEVAAEELEKAIEKVYQRQRGRINVPGFRKGKAPRAIIEKMYGTGIFLEDAANDVINATYPDAVDECGESVVSDPELGVTQLEAGKDFIYTADVALKPPVSLGKYKGVETEKINVEVTDEELENRLKSEQEKNASFKQITDRPVADGDMITLDFEGFVDDVAFEGGKGEDYPLTIGSGTFIPGFEEQLVGAEIGKELDVNVTFPENYQAENLKGKPAVFKCTVKAIREKELPELNDEFADEVSEFSTLEEYKADLKKTLLESKQRNAQTQKEDAVIGAIVEDSAIEIPAPMLETQKKQMLDEFAQQLRMQGMTLEQYAGYAGVTRNQLLDELAPNAERRIRTRLVLEEIAKQENITATEEEYEQELSKMAEQYRTEVDNIKKMFTDRDKERMMEDLAVQKAATFVTDAAVEVEKKAEEKKED